MDSATNLEAFRKRGRWFVPAGPAGATARAWADPIAMAAEINEGWHCPARERAEPSRSLTPQ